MLLTDGGEVWGGGRKVAGRGLNVELLCLEVMNAVLVMISPREDM